MAINLIFRVGMKVFMVRIVGRKIFYNDPQQGLHEMYPNPDETSLRMAGKPTPQEMREYEMCKTEDELAAFVIRDCKKAGASLYKEERA